MERLRSRAAIARISLVAAIALSTAACAIPFTRIPKEEWQTRPAPGKALVSLLYAGSGWGGMFATVFREDASGQDVYIGTLYLGTHLTQQLDPGDYRFAVVGNTVDLMDVSVEAGKSYHGLIAAYMAPNKPFSGNYGHYRFEAINDPADPRLAEWMAKTAEVVPSDKGRKEGAGHKKRLAKLKPGYLPKWEASDSRQRLYVPTPIASAP